MVCIQKKKIVKGFTFSNIYLACYLQHQKVSFNQKVLKTAQITEGDLHLVLHALSLDS